MNWSDLLKHGGEIIVILGFLAGFGGFFARPLVDKMFTTHFERNRKEVKATLEEWFKEELDGARDVSERLSALELQFTGFLQTTVERDKALTERFMGLLEDQNKTLEQLGESMMKLHQEAELTARSVSNIYGLLDKEPWDGITERRKHRRRAT